MLGPGSKSAVADSDKPTLTEDSTEELINKTFEPWYHNLKQTKLLYLFLFLLKGNYKKIALNGNLEEKDISLFSNPCYSFK